MSSERQCRLRHGVGECLTDALLCEGDCPLQTRARYTRMGGQHLLQARKNRDQMTHFYSGHFFLSPIRCKAALSAPSSAGFHLNSLPPIPTPHAPCVSR